MRSGLAGLPGRPAPAGDGAIDATVRMRAEGRRPEHPLPTGDIFRIFGEGGERRSTLHSAHRPGGGPRRPHRRGGAGWPDDPRPRGGKAGYGAGGRADPATGAEIPGHEALNATARHTRPSRTDREEAVERLG